MARNALFEMLFLFLIVFDGCDASLGWELRKLVGVDPKNNNTPTAVHDSPSPTSLPGDNKLDPKPVDESGKEKTEPPSTDTSQKGDPKISNNTISPVLPPVPKTDNDNVDPKESKNTTRASPSPVTKTDDEKTHEKENKNGGQIFSQLNTNENCDHFSHKCKVDGDMVACISEDKLPESKYLVVIIQNGGDDTIKVKLFMESNLEDIEVAKHQNIKINISVTSSGSTQLTLKAGKGACVLGTSGRNFLHLPSYQKLLTPVNGAYFLLLAVLVFGGSWACCKLRKKEHDGVPYQELEMGMPESASATNVEVAEGWDQYWDDDWDEDVAVKSPGMHAGSISANGLTSRSSNREGWENNWDD